MRFHLGSGLGLRQEVDGGNAGGEAGVGAGHKSPADAGAVPAVFNAEPFGFRFTDEPRNEVFHVTDPEMLPPDGCVLWKRENVSDRR